MSPFEKVILRKRPIAIQLSLYYGIGRYVSINLLQAHWGTKALDAISERLQRELPGLRGFSSGNLKKMRIFYEEWRCHTFYTFIYSNSRLGLKACEKLLNRLWVPVYFISLPNDSI